MDAETIPNFVKLLKILELDISQWIELKNPVRFQNIILSDESFFVSDANDIVMFSDEYLEMIDKIKAFSLKNYSPLSEKNFYFFYGRYSLGEEHIANYFQYKGFVVIKPEKYSL